VWLKDYFTTEAAGTAYFGAMVFVFSLAFTFLCCNLLVFLAAAASAAGIAGFAGAAGAADNGEVTGAPGETTDFSPFPEAALAFLFLSFSLLVLFIAAASAAGFLLATTGGAGMTGFAAEAGAG
jgi:hypothetical protein